MPMIIDCRFGLRILYCMPAVNKTVKDQSFIQQPSQTATLHHHNPEDTPFKSAPKQPGSHSPQTDPFSRLPQRFSDASEETLKKLLQMNQNYLIEKIKVSDVPTPPKFSHKIPSKTGNSEYNRNFGGSSRLHTITDSVPQRDKTGSILKLPNCNITSYQSTYHKDFDNKEQNRSKSVTCKAPAKYQKPEGPNFNESSYNRDYSSVAQSPTTSAKRMQVRLMGGGKLNDSTTYKQFYSHQQHTTVPQPVIHKDNRIFTQLQNPQISSYQSTFVEKKKAKSRVESCKPSQKYTPQPRGHKYRTEYAEVFVPQVIARKKEFGCMSPAQLKNYVMTILDH